MGVAENPQHSPKQTGWLRAIGSKVFAVASALCKLFAEDPRVGEILTPEFIQEFVHEHRRMCAERRQGVRGAGLAAAFDANGTDMPYRMFDVLIKQYPKILVALPEVQSKVRMALLDECGLIPGGL